MAKVSLLMIALNEAKFIGEALDSVQGVVDEMIVVDTGSTDATREIATSKGARVERFAWTDDYSAARNRSVELCTSDWALMLDADERLLPGSRELVRECVEEPNGADAFLTNLIQHTPGGAVRTPRVRLASGRHRRFSRRIHEQISPNFTAVHNSRIELEHLGTALGNNLEKMGRYESLLIKALEDDPGDLYISIELMRTWQVLANPEWKDLFRKIGDRIDLNAPLPPTGEAEVWLEVAFRMPDQELPGLPATEVLSLVAQRWFPRSLPLMSALMLRYLKEGDPFAACAVGERALKLLEFGSFAGAIAFDMETVRSELLVNQGIALSRIGMKSAALAHLTLAAQSSKVAAMAHENIRRLGLHKAAG